MLNNSDHFQNAAASVLLNVPIIISGNYQYLICYTTPLKSAIKQVII